MRSDGKTLKVGLLLACELCRAEEQRSNFENKSQVGHLFVSITSTLSLPKTSMGLILIHCHRQPCSILAISAEPSLQDAHFGIDKRCSTTMTLDCRCHLS